MYSRIAGTGCASASSGTQRRPASLVPSASGIQIVSWWRIAFGGSEVVMGRSCLRSGSFDALLGHSGGSLLTVQTVDYSIQQRSNPWAAAEARPDGHGQCETAKLSPR